MMTGMVTRSAASRLSKEEAASDGTLVPAWRMLVAQAGAASAGAVAVEEALMKMGWMFDEEGRYARCPLVRAPAGVIGRSRPA